MTAAALVEHRDIVISSGAFACIPKAGNRPGTRGAACGGVKSEPPRVGGMAERVVVLVSVQAVLDHAAYRVLYGVQITDTDPGHVLAVSGILDDTPVWFDAAAGLMALRRSLLTKHLATINADTLTSLDARLAAALDH